MVRRANAPGGPLPRNQAILASQDLLAKERRYNHMPDTLLLEPRRTTSRPPQNEPAHVGPHDTNGAASGASLHSERDLLAGHVEGCAVGLMVGLGETYLAAFALALGLGEIFAGLVASVPLVAGGIMQLISPFMVHRFRSHKRWVMVCATVQATSFIPLAIAATLGRLPGWAVLVVASIYWGSGLASGPAWNTWVGTIVPRPIRAQYFARRTKLMQAAVMTGFLAAGIALHLCAQYHMALYAFAGIFASAALARMVSTATLAMQSEPTPIPANMQAVTLRELAHQFLFGQGNRLLAYIVAVQLTVQIAGPFFTPFMLGKLHFSYADYTILIATSFVAKILALPVMGRIAQNGSAERLLWIGGLGIVPLSALWIVSQSFPWLIVLQLAGGVAWAAYELAFFLLFFESIPEERRTGVLTLYNLANTVAWVGGALLGGALLTIMAKTHSAYLTVFVISGVGRLAALLLLWRVPGVRTAAASPALRSWKSRLKIGAGLGLAKLGAYREDR